MRDRPISEQWRLASLDWCDQNNAANLLEETKSAVFARMMTKHGDMPVSRAEVLVRSSQEWLDFIKEMTGARDKAARLKVEADYLKMRHSEQMSQEANYRSERKL